VHYISGCLRTMWGGLRNQPLVGAILAAHLVLGVLYSVVVPMWEANDETGHFAFVKYLASERKFPPAGQKTTPWHDEAHKPPLYHVIAALAISWIDTDDGLEPEKNPYNFAGANWVVHSDREAFPYHGTALAMHVARLVSVLISTAVVAVTYLIGRLLFPQDEAIATGAMAVNAFWPKFLFLGAVVTNDVLVPLFSSLLILFLLRMAYRRNSLMDFVGLGLCLAGALATKATAWALIPLAVVVLILIAIRKVPARARWWVLPLIWFCFSGAWMWFRGVALADHWFETIRFGRAMVGTLSLIQHPLRQATQLHWEVLPDALTYCSRTMWASFGWDNVQVEAWVQHVFILLCVAGAAGLIAFMPRRSKTGGRFGAVVIMLGVLFLFAPLIYFAVTRGPHLMAGRYASGAIPLLSLLLFLGLTRLVPRRHAHLLAMVVGGSLCALALIIPFRYIAPAYARPPILSVEDVQDIQHPLEANFGNKIELLGYDMDPDEPTIRGAIEVALYWRALSEMEENYTVGVHLVGPDYESYGGPDNYPARGNYATSLWKTGDIIRDTYYLRIPRDFPAPSAGRVEVALHLHSTGERLRIVSPQGEAQGYSVFLGPFGVVPMEETEHSIQDPLDHTVGDAVALVGYHIPDTIPRALPLTLYWQGLAKMEEDYTVFVHIIDEQGNLLGQDDSQPCDGRYPTSVWGEGRIIEDRHYIKMSRALSPGRHQLRIVVGMYLLETMKRLPVFDADGTRLRHDQIVVLHDVQAGEISPAYIPFVWNE
jgi:4-amino-4-deoxy-L-arabinose transferase-like glycosyltransferase